MVHDGGANACSMLNLLYVLSTFFPVSSHVLRQGYGLKQLLVSVVCECMACADQVACVSVRYGMVQSIKTLKVLRPFDNTGVRSCTGTSTSVHTQPFCSESVPQKWLSTSGCV